MQRQDELMLSEAFHEGTRQVRKALGQGTPLQIINFDWHGMIRDLKEKETVRCLWQHLQALLPRTDLSAGSMEPVHASAPADASDRFVNQSLQVPAPSNTVLILFLGSMHCITST